MGVTVVVSPQYHQTTLNHIEGNWWCHFTIIKIHLPTLRVTVVVVGNEGRKQLPMMVFGTEQLAPLERGGLIFNNGGKC